METNIYEVSYRNGISSSFFFQTNCPEDKFEEIERNAELLTSMEVEKLNEPYKRYAVALHSGFNKITNIKYILADQGYTYKEIKVKKIYW